MRGWYPFTLRNPATFSRTPHIYGPEWYLAAGHGGRWPAGPPPPGEALQRNYGPIVRTLRNIQCGLPSATTAQSLPLPPKNIAAASRPHTVRIRFDYLRNNLSHRNINELLSLLGFRPLTKQLREYQNPAMLDHDPGFSSFQDQDNHRWFRYYLLATPEAGRWLGTEDIRFEELSVNMTHGEIAYCIVASGNAFFAGTRIAWERKFPACFCIDLSIHLPEGSENDANNQFGFRAPSVVPASALYRPIMDLPCIKLNGIEIKTREYNSTWVVPGNVPQVEDLPFLSLGSHSNLDVSTDQNFQNYFFPEGAYNKHFTS